MPLYEYACEECGRETELLVTNATQPVCPKCGSEKLSKLLSMVSTHSRGNASSDRPAMPPGSCGSGCGCHPHA